MDYRQQFRSTAMHAAETGEDVLRNVASQISDGARELSETARDMATHYFNRGRRAMNAPGRGVEHFVEEQPVRTALIAIGIGCLVCAMFVRR